MVSIVVALCTLTPAQDRALPASTPVTIQDDAQALLVKLKASRDLLKTGAYRANGHILVNRQANRAEPAQGKIEIFSAFDFERKLLRFDETAPVLGPVPRPGMPTESTFRQIRTPEHAITWMKPWQNDNIGIMTAVGFHPPTLKSPLGHSPIDPRSLGMGLWDEFRAGDSFDTCYDNWFKSRWVEASPEANGMHRLRLLRGRRSGTYVPQTLWIDEHQGFSPVRLTYNIPGSEPGQPDQFNTECTVHWKHEGGAWVPTSFRIERRTGGRLAEFCALSFEWITINTPVQPDLFTSDGLGVPDGTRVIDYRGNARGRVVEVKQLPAARANH
jgi:hypothetical protein